MSNTAVVVIGGDAPHPHVVGRLPTGHTLYAADSGLDHAEALGLDVHRVIGDLDSVTPAALSRHRHVPIDRHPPDKDATDTELALDAAVAAGHDHVIVVSGGGDRLDHLLGSLTVLARVAGSVRLEAWIGATHVHVLHDGGRLHLPEAGGALVSLLPLKGDVTGVVATGLRWPLDGDMLEWGSSRGISNEALGDVSVSIASGVLAVLLPHTLDTGAHP